MVLVYPNKLDSIDVVVRGSSPKKHNEFLGTAEVGTFYKDDGTPVSWRPVVSVDNAEHHIVKYADPVSSGPLGTIRPKFQKVSIFGWEASLPEPDDEALKTLRSDAAAQNLAAQQSLSRHETKKRALDLSKTLQELLKTSPREEEVQQFLVDHPELIYPDYIDCHPKFPLGEDFVTDYVFLV